ncbi:MAG: hypothetical protein MH825_17030 [Cyanobacteria bacterium]|nr:hypothetical protein [Cyanobacteriota bacterium]
MVATVVGLLLLLLILNGVGYNVLTLWPDGVLRAVASLPQWVAIAAVVSFLGWCLRDDEDRSPPPEP